MCALKDISKACPGSNDTAALWPDAFLSDSWSDALCGIVACRSSNGSTQRKWQEVDALAAAGCVVGKFAADCLATHQGLETQVGAFWLFPEMIQAIACKQLLLRQLCSTSGIRQLWVPEERAAVKVQLMLCALLPVAL